MRGEAKTGTITETATFPARRTLVAAARRALWTLIRRRKGELRGARNVLRERIAGFLRRSDRRRLLDILRSGVLAGAVAAALAAPASARAQAGDLPLVELAAIARGEGGFIVRGEPEPSSGAGVSVAGAGDVNGDGIPDMIIGGRFCAGYCTSVPSYVVFGKRDDAAVELGEILEFGRGGFAIRGGAEADQAGVLVSGAGDVNGDGLADVLVGAYNASPLGRPNAGESYVVFGKADGELVELSDVRSGRGGFAILGITGGDFSGRRSLSSAGDVNADGLADVLVGAPGADPGGKENAGETYVVFGKKDGLAVELSDVLAGRGGFGIRGADPDPSVAAVLAWQRSVSGAGDVNGDGFADVVICAPLLINGALPGSQKSYLVFGKSDGAVVELADVQTGRGGFAIQNSTHDFGPFVAAAGVGDLDSDGLADFMVAVPSFSLDGRADLGESYVIFGKKDSGAVELQDLRDGFGGFAIRGNLTPGASGFSVAGAGDVDGDGLPDLLIGAPNATSGAPQYARLGHAYVVFGKPTGVPVDLAAIAQGKGGFVVRGVQNDGAAMSVSGAGDLNGDGRADLLIGAQYGRELAGDAYVVFGKANGAPVELQELEANRSGFVIHGSGQQDSTFTSLADAGDVNGDGLADFLVGVPYANPSGMYQAGLTYVVFGRQGVAPIDLMEARRGRGGFVIRGAAIDAQAGWSVAGAGDVNGDGLADILVGAPGEIAGPRYAGDVFVVFGKRDTEVVELADVLEGRGGFVVRGSTQSGRAGASVASAGDVNGDGLVDILIGAPYAIGAYPLGQAGESYVVFGKRDVEEVELSEVLLGNGGFGILGIADGDSTGWSVAGAGDVNGDGLADVLIGAPYGDGGDKYDNGESYVVFGKRDTTEVLLESVAAGVGGFAIHGSSDGAYAGWSVAGAGDVNGDGLADLLIGAYYASNEDVDYAGESYVVFGKKDGVAVELSALQVGRGGGFWIRGAAEYDAAGMSVSGVGDWNGDGLADVLIGAPGVDPPDKYDVGESYVVFGKKDGTAVRLTTVRSGRGGFAIRGAAAYDYSGRQVLGAGDLNGDGVRDIVIGSRLAGARYPSISQELSGAAYVVFGTGGPERRFLRGDGDADGKIDLTDAVRILNWLFRGGSPPDCIAATNADGNESVSLTDPIYLLNHLFRGGPVPPEPYPACGISSLATDEQLGCAIPPPSCR